MLMISLIKTLSPLHGSLVSTFKSPTMMNLKKWNRSDMCSAIYFWSTFMFVETHRCVPMLFMLFGRRILGNHLDSKDQVSVFEQCGRFIFL